MPSFFDEIVEAADVPPGLAAGLRRRLRSGRRQGEARPSRISLDWVLESCHGTGDWHLGRARYEELVNLRAFDGLDSDGILAIGWEQLERSTRLVPAPPARSIRARRGARCRRTGQVEPPADVRGGAG